MSQASFLRISHIDVSGTQTVISSTIVEKVQAQLEGEYLYLFPKNNILFYPKGHIVSALLAAMPVLASVDVSAKNFQTISVALVERQPKALWCGDEAANPMPCFLLDENGVAYGAVISFSGNAYSRYYGTLASNMTPKQYLTPAQFRSLSALVDTIAASQKNEPLASVWVDENKDVYMAFASGFTLFFALNVDGGDIYQRFTLALQSAPFKAHKLSDFEYLDLRFGDKLYYKLR
ncbi:MAG: hypothetical protein Q7R71_00600 [bacterium]|nr:hypothetical protein [bacterium]